MRKRAAGREINVKGDDFLYPEIKLPQSAFFPGTFFCFIMYMLIRYGKNNQKIR